MADKKLNSLAAIAKASVSKFLGFNTSNAEGLVTKEVMEQIIRDEIKTQLSAFTAAGATVPVFNSSGVLGTRTMAQFAQDAAGQQVVNIAEGDMDACRQNMTVYRFSGQTFTFADGTEKISQYGLIICFAANNYILNLGVLFSANLLVYRHCITNSSNVFSAWRYLKFS